MTSVIEPRVLPRDASGAGRGQRDGAGPVGPAVPDTAALLTRVAVAVNSTLELPEVLRRLAETAAEAIGADRGTVLTLDGDRLVPQVAIGPTDDDALWARFRSMGPVPLEGTKAIAYAAREPIAIADARTSDLIPHAWAETFDLRTVVLAPLFAADTPCGLLSLDWTTPREVGDEELGLVGMIAEHAGLAIRNASLFDERNELIERLDQQVRRLECLFQVSIACTEGADAQRMVRQLNDLLSAEGVEVAGVCFRDRRIARHLGSDTPTKAERALWRKDAEPIVSLPDGGVAVPMRLGRRCVGALRIAVDDLDDERRSFLEALGAGVAEVANRAAMRAEVERSAQERTVALERERLQADLHDTAGQTFVALKLVAGREAALRRRDPDTAERFERVVELAEHGRSELDQAVRALAFVPAGRRRLAASLRALCRSVQNDSGIRVEPKVRGPLRNLPSRVEYAVYRVASEAVMNSWRHARCSYVRVQVMKDRNSLCLEVVDDGIGLEQRHLGSAHVGIAGMRRLAAAVDGTLAVRTNRPRGARVELRVPLTTGEGGT